MCYELFNNILGVQMGVRRDYYVNNLIALFGFMAITAICLAIISAQKSTNFSEMIYVMVYFISLTVVSSIYFIIGYWLMRPVKKYAFLSVIFLPVVLLLLLTRVMFTESVPLGYIDTIYDFYCSIINPAYEYFGFNMADDEVYNDYFLIGFLYASAIFPSYTMYVGLLTRMRKLNNWTCIALLVAPMIFVVIWDGMA